MCNAILSPEIFEVLNATYRRFSLVHPPPPFVLKRDLPQPEKILERKLELTDETSAFGGIRCPLCQYRPKASDRWYCGSNRAPEGFTGGCGTSWNTFTTQGLCPGCGHQWRWTSCPRCHRWSLHKDWYGDEKG
ncbi:MAG: hypothetical protein KDJ52_24165 [Anaerolineae bacterium]|nr:hypothetical protein [Anaerolineae bacterium]